MEAPGGASSGLIRIVTEARPEAVIARVSGEVDITTAPRLRTELARLSATGRPVVLDLGAVSYFDLSGVRALEAALDSAAPPVILAALPSAVTRILDLVWPEKPVPVLPTVTAAIAYLTKGKAQP
jgi:anti-sigma B factor antagonist